MFILYFTVNPFLHISKEYSMHPYCSLPFSNVLRKGMHYNPARQNTRTSRKHLRKIRKNFPFFYSFLIIWRVPGFSTCIVECPVSRKTVKSTYDKPKL